MRDLIQIYFTATFNINSDLDCIIFYTYSLFSVRWYIPDYCHVIYLSHVRRIPILPHCTLTCLCDLLWLMGSEPVWHTPCLSGSVKYYCTAWLSPCSSLLMSCTEAAPSSWMSEATETGNEEIITQHSWLMLTQILINKSDSYKYWKRKSDIYLQSTYYKQIFFT